MNQLNGLTDAPAQTSGITLPDGTTAVLNLAYRPQQSGWFYDLTWNGNASTFQLNGCRLVTSPNVLRQFMNQLSFGLWVYTADQSEPIYQTDFLTGRVALYLLDPEDIANIEFLVFPGL
jgi:hypothetical protein